MKITEADLFRFCAGFGPVITVIGLMKLTGTMADAILACSGAASVSWVLLTVANVLVGPPISVTWKDISEEKENG
jgi:hypothetical protein|tara:strand:+ start:1399 stop:1623 length:225 start_codon:yes stop_codon:yes gene_type:complete